MPSPTSRLTITGILTGLAATFLLSSPAVAAPRAPGDFTGHGFDACVAPNQSTMDAWNLRSPFTAIGIYVSGSSRYCGDAYQPNLSKAWVATNAANGWRFMPIHVGRQAPCFVNNPDSRVQKKRMSYTVSLARSQARQDAAETIAALVKYGFGTGSYSYLDLEWYARTAKCDNVVLEFVDAWTEYLHNHGYKSGVYSSGSAAIAAIDAARIAGRPNFTKPDQLWIAWTNKIANTDGGPYLADDGWANHQRIHQYHNGVTMTYGGKSINIDKDFLDVGKGSVAVKDVRPCGVAMSFTSYPALSVGSQGPEVAALECLLHEQGFLTTVNETFGSATAKAIDAFRKTKGWAPAGHTTRPTWTALHAAGPIPHVLKQGTVGLSVWRIQRALIAAGLHPRLTGIFDSSTITAVKEYRKANGLTQYSTAEESVWSLLQRGKLG
ncbi:glycoside hydrolase domain-containing protein [Aeromicrobium ginsengisoli]|uniref:glycoside hydrolase domain-containing protein n=1 Tax=Aeromicrobium ginsengisoli TaxID=363867 RepID=UPI00165F6D44|nr:glycoside hydrolase domain-containing protein [Aeromicrobium ginsengisoli]